MNEYNFTKPIDCTGSNPTQPNKISIESITNIMNELGNNIEPKPIIPIPMPYAMVRIKEV